MRAHNLERYSENPNIIDRALNSAFGRKYYYYSTVNLLTAEFRVNQVRMQDDKQHWLLKIPMYLQNIAKLFTEVPLRLTKYGAEALQNYALSKADRYHYRQEKI